MDCSTFFSINMLVLSFLPFYQLPHLIPRIQIQTALSSQATVRRFNQELKQPNSVTKMDASYSQHAMAAELRGLWVGPMPVGKFIETFLPLSKETLATKPTFEKQHFATMADYTIEKDMYDSFVSMRSLQAFSKYLTTIWFVDRSGQGRQRHA